MWSCKAFCVVIILSWGFYSNVEISSFEELIFEWGVWEIVETVGKNKMSYNFNQSSFMENLVENAIKESSEVTLWVKVFTVGVVTTSLLSELFRKGMQSLSICVQQLFVSIYKEQHYPKERINRQGSVRWRENIKLIATGNWPWSMRDECSQHWLCALTFKLGSHQCWMRATSES